MDKKLDCCVVRDLLPAYIEALTEEGTSAQVRAHLETCGDCRALEGDMRAQVPVEKASKGALKFLKRVKRTRLIAAGVTLALTLWCICWLYDTEFHYPNTAAGRLAAAEDYITRGEDGSLNHGLKAGTAFQVAAWQEARGKLFLFYKADSRDNVHGIIQLTRGINGKYRTDRATMAPFPYTAGVMASAFRVEDGWQTIAIAGEGCREIYSAAVMYGWLDETGQRIVTGELVYPVPEADFLWLLEPEDIQAQLGVSPGDIWTMGVRFLDKDGRDITEQYRDDSVRQDWEGGGRGTAEQFLIYMYMGLAALLGGVLLRYFMRKD